jgi:hypothetical protein
MKNAIVTSLVLFLSFIKPSQVGLDRLVLRKVWIGRTSYVCSNFFSKATNRSMDQRVPLRQQW